MKKRRKKKRSETIGSFLDLQGSGQLHLPQAGCCREAGASLRGRRQALVPAAVVEGRRGRSTLALRRGDRA